MVPLNVILLPLSCLSNQEKARSQCCKCSVSCVYQLRNKTWLLWRNLGWFCSQDVHLDWLPLQPPTAVGVFLPAQVGDSLLNRFPVSFQGVFFNTKQVMMCSPLIHMQGHCVAPSACENTDFCSSGKNLCTLLHQAMRKAQSVMQRVECFSIVSWVLNSCCSCT